MILRIIRSGIAYFLAFGVPFPYRYQR